MAEQFCGTDLATEGHESDAVAYLTGATNGRSTQRPAQPAGRSTRADGQRHGAQEGAGAVIAEEARADAASTGVRPRGVVERARRFGKTETLRLLREAGASSRLVNHG